MTSTESTPLDEVCRHWSLNVSLNFLASRRGRGISGTPAGVPTDSGVKIPVVTRISAQPPATLRCPFGTIKLKVFPNNLSHFELHPSSASRLSLCLVD